VLQLDPSLRTLLQIHSVTRSPPLQEAFAELVSVSLDFDSSKQLTLVAPQPDRTETKS
jgi:hypothetical protein